MARSSIPTDGPKIRYHRQMAGWNLRPFAKHVGISPGYLSKLERGTDVPPATLKKIADALGLKVPDLVRLEEMTAV